MSVKQMIRRGNSPVGRGDSRFRGNDDLRLRNEGLRLRNDDLRLGNNGLKCGNGDLRLGNNDLKRGNGHLRFGNDGDRNRHSRESGNPRAVIRVNTSLLNHLTFLLLFFSFLFPAFSSAAVVKNLYQVTLPAPDQSAKQRSILMTQAFQQVLVKVSGQESVLQVPAISAALGDPDVYVSQFSYSTVSNPEVIGNLLEVKFQKSAVNQLLAGAGQPVWGVNRPVCLVWVVVKQPDGQMTLATDATHEIVQAFEKQGEARGLPVIFPLMDLKDLAAIQAQNLWFGDWPTIVAASQRYTPNAILVVQWDESSSPMISAHFVLSLDGQQSEWPASGADVQTLVNTGFNPAVDTIANAYAIRPGDQANESTLTFHIQGVTDLSALTRTLNFFQTLTGTEQVAVKSTSPADLVLEVQVQGNVDAYLQQITLGRVLTPLAATNAGDLTYHYEAKE